MFSTAEETASGDARPSCRKHGHLGAARRPLNTFDDLRGNRASERLPPRVRHHSPQPLERPELESRKPCAARRRFEAKERGGCRHVTEY
jgi:hypothetical protein